MTWREFIRSHTQVLAAADFFTVDQGKGKGNVILFPAPEDCIGERSGELSTHERLGGLLKFYHREGA